MVEKTIKVSEGLKIRIDKFKIHKRQSYEEVLGLLITHCEEAKEKVI